MSEGSAAVEKKGKTKRSKTRFPGLVREVNPKTRWEHIDHDYLDKLSDKEKEWLSNFNEEYLSGNFNHKGKKLHRTKKEKRECYSRNNARNRDWFTINRTKGWVVDSQDHMAVIESKQNNDPQSQENTVIELLDLKDAEKKKSG